MVPDAFIAHTMPNRLRIKIPARKKDISFLAEVKDVLLTYDGIKNITVHPVTGSILIHHDADDKSLIDFAETKNLFRINGVNGTFFSKTISSAFQGLNKKVTISTEGHMNIPDIVFLVLAGLGLYQIIRGNLTAPAWYAAFWYALNIFLKGRD